MVETTVVPLVEDTKNLIKQIDEYDEHARELDKQVYDMDKQNNTLKEALPQIEEQIALLKAELAEFEKIDLNPETIQNQIFKPKDDISAAILKQ